MLGKGPIPLVCASAKALEAAAPNRLAPLLEGALAGDQFAKRRDRGAEFHLTQLYDFLCSELRQGRFVDSAAMDIDGAFDNVPHASLLGALLSLDLDRFLCRCVAKWLQGRIFRARLRVAS